MEHTNVKYGILLTKAQLDFLKDNRQGFHRPKAFDTFLSLAAIEPYRYEKKNFSADLDIGQFAISKVELAELWGCDRKTAQKMIELFNEVGILTSVANNRTTIHTIRCVAFWFVNGQEAPIKNPHYQQLMPRTSSADQGKPSSEADNGISPSSPSMRNSSYSVSSVAEANDDEREENMLPPYGEDGQLPEEYYDGTNEHYGQKSNADDCPHCSLPATTCEIGEMSMSEPSTMADNTPPDDTLSTTERLPSAEDASDAIIDSEP